MNCTLMPSLQRTTLVKIAIFLWNQDDIRTLMETLNLPLICREECQDMLLQEVNMNLPLLCREEWLDIESKVIKKVSNLLLPTTLKNKILCFIKPVGIQVLRWMRYHVYKGSSICVNLPSNLIWTAQGTVDRKRTAKMLVNDKSLDITKRYILACIYCFENDILLLWNEIPKYFKTYFYNKRNNSLFTGDDYLVAFWTNLKGELNNMCTVENFFRYEQVFICAALSGSKAAAEYFLSKVAPEKRGEFMIICANCFLECLGFPSECNIDILCYLISQMNEEQQMTVFKQHSYKMLYALLSWPWQDTYLETAKLIGDFLSVESYDLLLSHVVKKVIIGYKDYNYQELFGKFWQQSSNRHKKYVIDHGRSALSKLFEVEDKENIILILKEATVDQKEKMIFCDVGKDICKNLFYDHKWNLLQFFVQECISSEVVMIKFKEEFKECITCHFSKENIWNKYFELIDYVFHVSDKKRCLEYGDSCLPKRLCSIKFEGST